MTSYKQPEVRPKTAEEWFRLEMEIGNLLTVGPVDEENLFAGRGAQVRQLLEATFDRSKHAVLFGERGVGKTSLSNVFWKRYGNSLQTIIAARVQADPSDTFSSLWGKCLEELRSFAVNSGRAVLIPLESNYKNLSPDDVRRELQKIKPNAIPIIIIDEFDKLRDVGAKELTANLIKSLSDYSVTTTIVIVGVAEDISQLIRDHESIKRCISQIKLDRMHTSELNEILNTRVKMTPLRLDGDARWKIVMLSRGLPYYAHVLGRYSFQSACSSQRLSVKDGDVDAAMDKFINDTSQSFNEDYKIATDSNQSDALFKEVILACALAKTDDFGFFSPSSVVEPLSRLLKKQVTHANFQRHLSEFLSAQRGGILLRRGRERQYRYRFTDPMMQPYIIIKGMRDKMIDDGTRAILSHPEQRSLPI